MIYSTKTDDLSGEINLPIDVRVAQKLRQIYEKCKANNLEFGLSFKRLKQMMQQETCYYRGVKFQDNVPMLQRSIDRVDSSKGYTDDNVVACTVLMNSIKSNLTYEQIKAVYKGVTKFRERQVKAKPKDASRKDASRKKAKLVILKQTG